MIIKTSNNLTVNAPRTYLTNLEVAGTNILRWKNPAGFNASWAIQVGNTGQEQAEIVLLGASTPAGTAGTLTANTLYEHPTDTPIYAIKYDQIVFERSTAGTIGTAVPMTNGTVTIQADNSFTQFDDTTGATTYAYRTYFRNSVLAINSTESDWITPAGFSFYSLGKMRQRVKDKLVSSQYLTDDTIINDWLNEYYEMMGNVAADVNEDYNLGTAQLIFSGTQELGTITQTDFKGGLRRVWYVDPTGTFQATKMPSNDFSPNRTFDVTYPYFYMQGDNVIGRKPSDTTGTLVFEYPRTNAVMVNDTDQIPATMQGYTKGFVDYALSIALFKDSKNEESQMKETSAMSYLQRFKTDISPRNRTGQTMISIVEDMGADETSLY
jgi:hypothetical protein